MRKQGGRHLECKKWARVMEVGLGIPLLDLRLLWELSSIDRVKTCLLALLAESRSQSWPFDLCLCTFMVVWLHLFGRDQRRYLCYRSTSTHQVGFFVHLAHFFGLVSVHLLPCKKEQFTNGISILAYPEHC